MVTESEKRDALARVLQSAQLRSSDRLRQFLTYVVETEIAGKADDLKAFTIAVDVYGRDASFDPQTNSLVRAEAVRLRRALKSYYASDGVADPVRIDLSVGGYVPNYLEAQPEAPLAPQPVVRKGPPSHVQFVSALSLFIAVMTAGFVVYRTTLGASDAVADRNSGMPRIEVQPVQVLSSDPISVGEKQLISELLNSRLARFDDLAVFEFSSPNSPDYRLVPLLLVENDKKSLELKLTQIATGRAVWSSSFSFPTFDSRGLDDAVSRIAAYIAQPYGIIYSVLRRYGTSPEMACVIRSFEFFRKIELDALMPAIRCLEEVIAQRPNFYIAHTALSRLSLFRYQISDGGEAQKALALAGTYADMATAIAPERPRVFKTIFEVRFFQRRFEEAFAASAHALSLNPDATDILFRVGAAQIARDRVDEGLALIRRAQGLNGATPNWVKFYIFLAAYLSNDVDHQRIAFEGFAIDDFPPSLAALILHGKGIVDDALVEAARQRMQTTYPDIMRDIPSMLDRYALAPSVRERFLAR